MLILLTSLLANCAQADMNWNFKKETDGIKVYEAKIAGSSVVAFRGEGEVDAPLAKVATVIFDTARAPEWISDLVESKILHWRSKNEFIEYDHVGTPPIIMKDRDFVSLVKMDVDPKLGQLTFKYHPATDESAPPTQKYIRGDLTDSSFVLTSIDNGTKTHFVGEILADPKGGVPKWIVNYFQSGWPVNTVNGLRKQTKKADVKTDPRFEKMIATGEKDF